MFLKNINHKIYPKLLDRSSLMFDGSIPFLVFNFYTKTHKLVPSPYFNLLSKSKEKLHKEIFKLYEKGIGYKTIHKELVEKGYKIGKSPTCIDSIIKKRIKRNEFLNQPVVEGYKDFDILFYKVNSIS